MTATPKATTPIFMAGKLRYKTGSVCIPESAGLRIIIHIVNDLGVFGAGVSGALGKRWPLVNAKYREWYRSQLNFKGGQVQEVQVQSDTVVINMLAQHGIMAKNAPDDPPIRYDQLAQCLEKVAMIAKNSGGSVHCARFGAGLSVNCQSGYDPEAWQKVEALITEKLINKGINVTVYDLPKEVKKEEK